MGHIREFSLEDLVQPRGGLVQELTWVMPARDEPDIPVAVATVGDVFAIREQDSSRVVSERPESNVRSSGAGISRCEARTAAIAEGLERYSASIPDFVNS